MPTIIDEQHKRLRDRMTDMTGHRQGWVAVWQEISDYFLPRRYPWLYILPAGSQGGIATSGSRAPLVRNSRLLDSTSTHALRTLATGMMNGITSPARPWFRLDLQTKKYEGASHPVNVWLEQATKVMHRVMGRTNLYNSLGILYQEWCAFGTASMGIYEDTKSVFRCKNYPVGGFMIDVDSENRVDTHARSFSMPLRQVVEKWPDAELPEELKIKLQDRNNVNSMNFPCIVHHLVEPNKDGRRFPGVRKSAEYREIYFLETTEHLILKAKGLDEFPHITPRWEVYADDKYGTSPCMEAMPDVLQLQHLVKRKAQGLDKMVSPPMLAHSSLSTKPKAFLPDGITYVNSADLSQGARPTYQIQIPFNELMLEVQMTQARIKEVLFNDLFRMISDLQTVRSASEIDARREEKLVLLGPVLERFESEGLAPVIERVFAIIWRAGLFPPVPQELEEEDIDIQYVSVLSDAQRAVGTVAVERFLAFLGGVAGMAPDSIQIPNWEEVIRYYADAIGVPPQLLSEPQDSEAASEEMAQMGQLKQAAEIGSQIAPAAEALSNTDVGGGTSALQALMGGQV